jgi:hypothetical protein
MGTVILNSQNRIAVVIAMITGAIVVPAIVIARHEPSRQGRLSRPITRAEAESLLAQTVRLARSGDVHGICDTIAAAKGTCEFLLQSGHQPGELAPMVARFDTYNAENSGHATAVLRLAGTRDDGTTYTSDFAVIRIEPDRLAVMTPIYWSGVIYGASAPTSPTYSR